MEKSPLERSTADVLGTSEAVRASDASQENATSAEDNVDNDVQPPTMMISKIQAPGLELLELLVQFVPKEFSKKSAVADQSAHSAKNAEIRDIKILSQFKLRYLCRRFRNIIHRQTPLVLNCFNKGDGNFGLFLLDRSCIRISRDKTLNQLAELQSHAGFASGFVSSSEPSYGMFHTIADAIDILLVSSALSDAGKYASIGAISRITNVLPQACKLVLSVVTPADNKVSASDFLEQSICIPLKQQLPSVTLKVLRYTITIPTIGPNPIFLPNLNFFLDSSFDSNLVHLHANLFGLSLPDDYVCASVESLKLEFRPLKDDYDYNDDGQRAAVFELYAKLPRWFPNVGEIAFLADRLQIDFTALSGFSGLTTVKLHSLSTEGQAKQDYRLASLTSVTSLCLTSTDTFPSHISVLAPNLRTLEFSSFNDYTKALADLRTELDSVKNSFELLHALTVKSTGGKFPRHRAFVLLLCSLARLPKLTSLQLEFVFPMDYSSRFTWCPAGDLSITRALPPHLTSTRLIFALRPGSVNYDLDSNEWSLNCIAGVPFMKESVYKDWLIALLHHIDEHPSLERFYCCCFAPSFEAIRALAEKWNKSSVAAIVELGLAAMIHVQCTPLYARMNETRIPARGDRFRFRFTLARRSKPLVAEASKHKAVTVDFQNP